MLTLFDSLTLRSRLLTLVAVPLVGMLWFSVHAAADVQARADADAALQAAQQAFVGLSVLVGALTLASLGWCLLIVRRARQPARDRGGCRAAGSGLRRHLPDARRHLRKRRRGLPERPHCLGGGRAVAAGRGRRRSGGRDGGAGLR